MEQDINVEIDRASKCIILFGAGGVLAGGFGIAMDFFKKHIPWNMKR